MSNLYYAYRGDNAGQGPPTAPSQQLSASTDSLPLHPPVPQPSAAQPSIPFSNHQAWAPDQIATLQNHRQQHPHTSANPPYMHSPPRAHHSIPMNATRAPLASRQTQYDDTVFQIMGKPFNDTTSRFPTASSPPSAQYSQLRPSQASNVFDPNDFPSLGGAMHSSASIQQTHAPQPRLSGTSPGDVPTIPVPGVSVSAGANGLSHFSDLYNLGPYSDGRGKAVDAITGASASAEFSMQSEDFPALGGAPAGAARSANGPASFVSGSVPFNSGLSVSKPVGTESLYGRQSAPTPAQLIPGAIQAGREVPSTSILAGRPPTIANGHQLGESPPSLPALDKGNHSFSALPSRTAEELRSSTSPSRGPLPETLQTKGKGVLGDLAGHRIELGVDNRIDSSPARQGPFRITAKIVTDGSDEVARVSIPNGPANRASGSTPLLSRLAEKAQENVNIVTSESKSVPTKYGMRALLPVVLPLSEGSGKAENILSVGLDLTALGLNLNSPEPLHKTFENPWDGGQGGSNKTENPGAPSRSQESEYKLPTCYYMQPPALRSSHFAKFQLETLFYIFYNMPRDVLQLLAAVELYSRKWRYHKDLKLWFTCDTEDDGSYDNGGYIYFDIKSWERRQFHEANQSFIQGLMTEDELNSVKIPSL